MRSGLLCNTCKETALPDYEYGKLGAMVQRRKLAPGTTAYLPNQPDSRDLGAASSNKDNVVDYWTRLQASRTIKAADMSASFSATTRRTKSKSAELPEAQSEGIRTWLDEEQLRPGLPWQVALEEQLRASKQLLCSLGILASDRGRIWKCARFFRNSSSVDCRSSQ